MVFRRPQETVSEKTANRPGRKATKPPVGLAVLPESSQQVVLNMPVGEDRHSAYAREPLPA